MTTGLGIGGAVGLLAMLMVVQIRRTRSKPSSTSGPVAGPPARCEVRRITIAFDWDVRASLQALLATVAHEHDFSTASGMKAGATATIEALATRLGDARYGIYEREHATALGAEAAFARRTIDLRARFDDEVVRGKETREGREYQARADEGRGLVAVSVVVGSMVSMPPLPATPTREAFAKALADVGALGPHDLVAFEVVWSPAKDQDRMSSYELEQVYPELLRLDDDASLGAVQCRYCQAPHPAELGRCPACGAPHQQPVARSGSR
ncbi:MAG: DUF1517 domain-containing protein [Sandaracinaceae bacterium]